ncbi:MAG: hypothetical protein GX843_07205, partial [Synergistaceae bacterium]|nr:hypothetical protein [Synergistaceae bacterium]
LNTLKDCDAIYVMEEGRFADRGTYDELMSRNEAFIKMARAEESGKGEGKNRKPV